MRRHSACCPAMAQWRAPHTRSINLRNIPCPKQRHVAAQIGGQNAERTAYPGFTAGGEAVEVWPRKAHRSCSECQCLDHIGCAPYTAIKNHFRAIAYCVDYSLQ